MKQIIKKITVVLLVLMALSSCEAGKQEEKGIKIVTTIFPLYDWTKCLTRGVDELKLLQIVSSASDFHSYQPGAKDIAEISDCDLLIYVGGESEEWIEDVLANAGNPEIHVVNLMEVLGNRVLAEEEKEGMEKEQGEEEAENDEHLWLSLKNAVTACEKICDALCEKDPENKALYENNLASYLEELNEMDQEYENVVRHADRKVLLFADRFPFLYLCRDYGLDYFAAFKGCSAESEASFETIRFLSTKVRELGLKAILCLENGNQKIAQTVKENAQDPEIEILEMNSMQSGIKEGDSYLSIAQSNLQILKKALIQE